MSDTDDAAGVFEAIDAEQGAHDPVQQEAISEPTGEGEDAEAENKNPKQTETVTEAKTDSKDTQANETATSTETGEPSKTETQTPADAEEVTFDVNQLPPAPQGYTGKVPEIDQETGQITNMTPMEYATYMRESTKAELRLEGYNAYVENAALDAAEKILPDIKTNPSVRQLVENARVASIYQGKMINSFEAAKLVREALGLAPAKIAAAEAKGAQNAKTSISIQKNSALETSSSQKNDDQGDHLTALQKRVRRGDSEAFVEMLGYWEKEGKL